MPGDKRWIVTRKETSFLLLTIIMGPKLTPLFHPKSDEEANRAIQVARDAKVQLMHLNEGLLVFNWKAEAAKTTKAKQQ